MRTVFCDIETNGLDNPDTIWCIVCKDADTGEISEFLNVHENPADFLQFSCSVDRWVGHAWLNFDGPVLDVVLASGISIRYPDGSHPGFSNPTRVVDTLVISQLINFPRPEGHSLESYGTEVGIAKVGLDISDWSTFDPRMLLRCHSDVQITEYVYKKYYKYITSPKWASAIATEQALVPLCNELKNNGFFFNREQAVELKGRIDHEISGLDKELARVFPPRSSLVREITPRLTKHGTIHRGELRWVKDGDFTPFSEGATFSRITFEAFNPGSTKQRIDRLWEAGWKPTEKTKGYKEFLRSIPRNSGKRQKQNLSAEQQEKKVHFEKYGWKTDLVNLSTLPSTAPPAFKTLVRWLLLKPRSRRIDEWLNCCGVDSRIHGTFRGIGAWSGRMAHSGPNMGNVPKFDKKQPETTPYSDEMRRLWQAAPGKFLVGVDAESIQLRVLAHYLEDEEFTRAIVSGRKEDGTDPHSVNQRAIGAFCKSREDAKTFIYAWLLGAGLGKVAEILKCSGAEAAEANDNFIERYTRLKWLKEKQIPKDAYNGWFQGFDGRAVTIPGETQSEREHLTLAGYLQSGETIVMKHALQIWHPKLTAERVPFTFVNFVHDEWQTEVPRDMAVAEYVAKTQADAIRQVGINLNLRCPMAGSILAGHGGLAIGSNWMETH